MAIIIDNKMDNVENIIMSDDGTGSGIRIPAMIIGRRDGEEFKNFINFGDDSVNDAIIQVQFSLINPENHVNYELWYSASDDRALDFIRDFEEFHLSLGDSVTFTPRIVTWACPFC